MTTESWREVARTPRRLPGETDDHYRRHLAQRHHAMRERNRRVDRFLGRDLGELDHEVLSVEEYRR